MKYNGVPDTYQQGNWPQQQGSWPQQAEQGYAHAQGYVPPPQIDYVQPPSFAPPLQLPAPIEFTQPLPQAKCLPAPCVPCLPPPCPPCPPPCPPQPCAPQCNPFQCCWFMPDHCGPRPPACCPPGPTGATGAHVAGEGFAYFGSKYF